MTKSTKIWNYEKIYFSKIYNFQGESPVLYYMEINWMKQVNGKVIYFWIFENEATNFERQCLKLKEISKNS